MIVATSDDVADARLNHMVNRLCSFSRGYGSIAQLQPETASRDVSPGDFNSRMRVEQASAQHIRYCWAFVTASMREVALRMLADDGLVQGIAEYLDKCPNLNSHRNSAEADKMGHPYEGESWLDLWNLNPRTPETRSQEANGHQHHSGIL